MKKIFAILISVLIILSSFSVMAFAESVAHISVDDVVVKSGEDVEMPIKISGNKGIWGLVFNVHFDAKAFQVKEVRSTGDVFNKSDIMIGPADFNDGYIRVVITPADVMNNNTNNGTICTVILEQTDYTVATTYPFTFEYEKTDFINIDAQVVSISSTDGSVSVVDDANKPTSTVVNNSTSKNENTTAIETTVAKNTDNKQSSKVEKDNLGDVIAQAEDNKIIDNYTMQTQTENVVDEKETSKDKDSNDAPEKESASNIVENNKVENDVSGNLVDSQETVGASANPSSNLMNIIIYVAAALLLAGIVVLIVVFVKRK